MKKAILINTEKQCFEEIYIGHYTEIYKAIGNGCSMFCCPITFENEDAMYCDDEGLFNPFQGGILMKDWAYPIVGNIVLLGTDENGESEDVKTSIQWLKKNITFLTADQCIKLFV